MPGISLGDVIPNVEAESTHGPIKLHEYVGDGWVVLFSHPGDYTPVCTTELGKVAEYQPEFTKRGVKLLGLSTDSVEDHMGWIKDIEHYTEEHSKPEPPKDPEQSEELPTVCAIRSASPKSPPAHALATYKPTAVEYPILADPDRKLTAELNMLDPDEKGPDGRPLASRALHIIGPDKKLKLSFLYPGTTGRNFDEVIRVIDSLQLAAKHKIATPAQWQKGEDVVISPTVSDEAAKEQFPQGWTTVHLPSGKPYLRMTNVS